MNQDRIRVRCESMSTADLVRAVTVERAENSVSFRQTALQTLEARGIDLDDFIERITLQLNRSEEVALNLSAALERIDESLPLWDVLVLTNSLGDSLALQREPSHWTVHIYVSQSYDKSHFVDSKAELRNFVSSFLRLEKGVESPGQGFHLDNWEVVIETESSELVEKATADLKRADILHTVQVPLISGDEEGSLSVLVRPEDVDVALEAIDESAENIEDLYEQAANLAAGGDRVAELAIYDRLRVKDPENAAVFYNRACLLLELRRFDESVDSLCEAVAIGLKSTNNQLEMGGAGGGGLFGIIAVLLRQSGSSAKTDKSIRYPDYIDDAEMILTDLETRLPDNTKLLHSLASIARLKNDVQGAEARYRRILEIDADDRIAYFNLGYLHSEQGGGEGEP